MFGLIPWRTKNGNQSQVAPYDGQTLARWQNDFDSFFDRWRQWLTSIDKDSNWSRFWDCHLEDRDNEFIVKAELPGFDKDELDVQVSGQVLTIAAEKKHERKDEKHYSSYRRSVTLPRGANLDKVDARYKNGVLEVHLPKTEEAKGKRITVKA